MISLRLIVPAVLFASSAFGVVIAVGSGIEGDQRVVVLSKAKRKPAGVPMVRGEQVFVDEVGERIVFVCNLGPCAGSVRIHGLDGSRVRSFQLKHRSIEMGSAFMSRSALSPNGKWLGLISFEADAQVGVRQIVQLVNLDEGVVRQRYELGPGQRLSVIRWIGPDVAVVVREEGAWKIVDASAGTIREIDPPTELAGKRLGVAGLAGRLAVLYPDGGFEVWRVGATGGLSRLAKDMLWTGYSGGTELFVASNRFQSVISAPILSVDGREAGFVGAIVAHVGEDSVSVTRTSFQGQASRIRAIGVCRDETHFAVGDAAGAVTKMRRGDSVIQGEAVGLKNVESVYCLE